MRPNRVPPTVLSCKRLSGTPVHLIEVELGMKFRPAQFHLFSQAKAFDRESLAAVTIAAYIFSPSIQPFGYFANS